MYWLNQTSMDLKQLLISWAETYETPDFIKTDPIQFPHRFTLKQDIEISAFLAAYLAFGQRSQIIKKVNELHSVMGASPYGYILNGDFSAFPHTNKKFYRFISFTDMNNLLTALQSYYSRFEDLEAAVTAEIKDQPMEALQRLFGHIHYIPPVGSTSACKRISMFLRWVARTDSCVDLGIWKSVDRSKLLIPLDTHVHNISLKLGITNRKCADMITAKEINRYFQDVFPDDPSRGDFALFGYAVDNKTIKEKKHHFQ